MKTSFYLATAGMLAASSAFAEGLSYGSFVGSYTQARADGEQLNVTNFGGEAGFAMNGFDAYFGFNRVKLEDEATADFITIDTRSIGVGYTVNNSLRFDLSNSNGKLSVAGFSDDIGLNEIGIAYDNGQYFARGSLSRLDEDNTGIDNLMGLHVGVSGVSGFSGSVSAHWVNETNTNLVDKPILIATGAYEQGPFQVHLDAARTELAGARLTALGLSGKYDINDSISVYGGFANADLDGIDVNAYRIGGAYDISSNVQVFADVGKLTLEGATEDATSVTFGMRLDLGDKRASHETTIDRLGGVVADGLLGTF